MDDVRTVGSELPKEMARVRDVVIPQYESIGPSGSLAVGLMRLELDRAAAAMAEGDLTAMIRAYGALREFKS